MRELFFGGIGGAAGVAVLVSLYNSAQYITDALDSVAGQTLDRLELIVCDDCSIDEGPDITVRWMEKYAGRFCRLRFVGNDVHGGLSITRNVALALAEAPYTFILDADNFIFPRCLKRLRGVLEDAPEEVAFVYSQRLVFDDGNRLSCRLENLSDWDPLRLWLGNYIDSMVLHRTRALRSMGGYTVGPPFDRVGGEDYELLLRYALHGWRGIKVPQPLMAYRTYAGSEADTVLREEKKVTLCRAIWDRFPELYGSD